MSALFSLRNIFRLHRYLTPKAAKSQHFLAFSAERRTMRTVVEKVLALNQCFFRRHGLVRRHGLG